MRLSNYTIIVRDGGVAQLARAPGSYPVGHEFKSLLRYHNEKFAHWGTSFFVRIFTYMRV